MTMLSFYCFKEWFRCAGKISSLMNTGTNTFLILRPCTILPGLGAGIPNTPASMGSSSHGGDEVPRDSSHTQVIWDN